MSAANIDESEHHDSRTLFNKAKELFELKRYDEAYAVSPKYQALCYPTIRPGIFLRLFRFRGKRVEQEQDLVELLILRLKAIIHALL